MRIVLLFLTSLFLSACSSTPTHINYYLLDAEVVNFENKSTAENGTTINLKQLKLAHYLQSTRLPLLQHDQGVTYANQHVWAEPLEQSISRILVHDFKYYSAHQLRLNTMPNAQDSEHQLQIHIDHFSATDDASVILVGNYWLDKKEHSFYFKQPLNADGFSHSVGQQRHLIPELVKMITHDINTQP